MEPDTLQASMLRDRRPGLLQVCARRTFLLRAVFHRTLLARLVTRDDVRVSCQPGKLLENRESRGREIDRLLSCFRVRQEQQTPLPIDIFPARRQYFADARAGQDEEPN